MASLKQTLHQHCLNLAEDKIETCRKRMQEIQAAANEETKSSAGDKYETGRAMMQLEKDKFSAQLANATDLYAQLKKVNPSQESAQIGFGSLVFTNERKYYISAGLGKVVMDGKEFYLISMASPLGKALKDLKAGDSTSFLGRTIEINEVY